MTTEETIKQQDEIIGRLTRENEWLQDSKNARERWLEKAKEDAGYKDLESFDAVWKDALAALKKCNEPLKEKEYGVVRFFSEEFDLVTAEGRLDYIKGLFNAVDFLKGIDTSVYFLNGFDEHTVKQAISTFEKLALMEQKRLIK